MEITKENKESYIQCIVQSTGIKHKNKEIFKVLEKLREISVSCGLKENDLDALCNFFINTKLDSQFRINLLYCLIPESKFPKDAMKKMLFWFFKETGSDTITRSVEKQFLIWLIGIVHFELTDLVVVDSYYSSFLFSLNRPHSLGSICKLLCVLSKPEDAKRWVVEQIMKVHLANECKSHTTSLLSLLKSYKPEVVPEKIPFVNFSYENFGNFDEGFKQCRSRNLHQFEETIEQENIKWNSWQLFCDKKQLPRIIPPPENLNLSNGNLQKENKMSVVDMKTLASLGSNLLKIEYPAQVLSLLANKVGFHLLAFGDEIIKTRFFHTLYHVLCKVFLLDIYPYSGTEKIHFLNSIKSFQEYTHQSIPVVTNFLFSFIPVWDGESYMKEIFGLLEWVELRPEEDLNKHLFIPLRQIFVSSGIGVRCLMIKSLGKMLRNWLVMDKREKNLFLSHYEACHLVKVLEAVGAFVGELITTGLIWNNERKTRNFLMVSLDFYEVTQAVEIAGDLPTIIIMPSSLVYNCLFSGSRFCIARICKLLTGLQMHSVERLFQLGVYHDFLPEVQKLYMYMLDYYRCLWSSVTFRKDDESFLFNENIFGQVFWKFKEIYGDFMNSVFSIEYNYTFWNPQSGFREKTKTLADDYPSIFQIKQLMETQLLK